MDLVTRMQRYQRVMDESVYKLKCVHSRPCNLTDGAAIGIFWCITCMRSHIMTQTWGCFWLNDAADPTGCFLSPLSDPGLLLCNEPKKHQHTAELSVTRGETSGGPAPTCAPASFGLYFGSSALRLIWSGSTDSVGLGVTPWNQSGVQRIWYLCPIKATKWVGKCFSMRVLVVSWLRHIPRSLNIPGRGIFVACPPPPPFFLSAYKLSIKKATYANPQR